MISNTKLYKAYLIVFFVTTSLLLIGLCSSNLIFFLKSQEFASFDAIYQKQTTQDLAIYGSSIIDDVKQYKLFVYSKKQPKIITLGSSRTLQFRERFFNKPFYNLGYTMSSIEDGTVIVDQLLKNHVPEVVILNLDFWWFNDNVNHPSIPKNFFDNVSGHHFKYKYLKLPIEWLKTGSITLSDYVSLLFSKNNNIGVRGILRNSGIGNDGSFYYTDVVTGDPRLHFYDKNFADIKQRINTSTKNLEYGHTASKYSLNKLQDILHKLEQHGVRTVLFLPPIPTEILSLLNTDNYKYIQDLKTQLTLLNIKVYDYSEPSTLNSNTCEFIDGFHGGDVLYSRILRDLAKNETYLENYINRPLLDMITSRDQGRSFSPDQRVTAKNEIDFLNIGCKKSYVKL